MEASIEYRFIANIPSLRNKHQSECQPVNACQHRPQRVVRTNERLLRKSGSEKRNALGKCSNVEPDVALRSLWIVS
ncbi:unnamed protein product [Colias eurytheme]|nr:unnamed protein product [Colias eurytheme]